MHGPHFAPPGSPWRGWYGATMSDTDTATVDSASRLLEEPGDALLVVDVQRDFLPGGALGVPDGLTLQHFMRAYTRAQNLDPLVNTLTLALGTGLLSVVLGVPLAWATARTDMPLRRTVQALVAVSYITPPYLTALAYIILMGPDAGYFNRVLSWATGSEKGPFNVFSMSGIVLAVASTSTPSVHASPRHTRSPRVATSITAITAASCGL